MSHSLALGHPHSLIGAYVRISYAVHKPGGPTRSHNPPGFQCRFHLRKPACERHGCTVSRHEDTTRIALCAGSRCFISDVASRFTAVFRSARCSSSFKGKLSRRLPALGSWRSSRLGFLKWCLPKCSRCKAAASSLVEAGFANLSPMIPFIFTLIFTCRRRGASFHKVA